jgi:hypothetical protein
MATAPDSGHQRKRPQLPDRFKMVEGSSGPQHVVRDPAGAKVSKVGRTPLNVESSEIVERLANEEFGGIHKCGIVWHADEDAQEIAGYLDEPNAKNVTAIKRDTPGGPLFVFLSRTWKQHPKMRPSTTKWCTFTLKPEGYFIIHLAIPLDRLKTPRTKKRSQPQQPSSRPSAPEE